MKNKTESIIISLLPRRALSLDIFAAREKRCEMDEEKFKAENETEIIVENDESASGEIQPDHFTDVSACPVIIEELEDEILERAAKQSDFKRKLAIALLGLFISPFFGAGFPLSLYSFIKSLLIKRRSKSKTILWAFTISAIGVMINLAVFFLFVFYINTHEPAPPII